MNMHVTTAPVGGPITTAIARIEALDAAAVDGLPDASMDAITGEIAALWAGLAVTPCGTAAEPAANLRLALLDGLAGDWDAVQDAAVAA